VTFSTIFHRVGSPPSEFRPYWVPNGVECEAPGALDPVWTLPRCGQDTSRKTDCWSLGLHKVFLKLL
jgi:hypothetical protein